MSMNATVTPAARRLPRAERRSQVARAAATVFMAVFVTAFSLLTDALRDALDPKLR